MASLNGIKHRGLPDVITDLVGSRGITRIHSSGDFATSVALCHIDVTIAGRFTAPEVLDETIQTVRFAIASALGQRENRENRQYSAPLTWKLTDHVIESGGNFDTGPYVIVRITCDLDRAAEPTTPSFKSATKNPFFTEVAAALDVTNAKLTAIRESHNPKGLDYLEFEFDLNSEDYSNSGSVSLTISRAILDYLGHDGWMTPGVRSTDATRTLIFIVQNRHWK